jgi:ornithine cyclodeaminase/alanine dehydrogenase-like protein (mu-crystallin family)
VQRGSCKRVVAQRFRSLEVGEVQTPARTEVTVAGKGFSLTMPAWRPGMAIAVKVVNVFEANLELGLPTHLAMITLYDPDTGAAGDIGSANTGPVRLKCRLPVGGPNL